MRPMRAALLLAVLLAAPSPVLAASPLVGKWEKNGAPYSEVFADGTGVVRGERVAWKADGDKLALFYEDGRVERMTWKIAGRTLTVTMGGQTDAVTRAGGAAPAGGKGAKKAAADKAGGDKLSKLLMSSAWCYLRYNKISGSTHTERVVFRPDGTWASGARGETYSSGANGVAYGQTDSSSGGRWKTKGSTWLTTTGASLLMSKGRGPLEDVGLALSQNSNGYPILNAGGKEYSSCN
jgi:hypothetical protein